MDTPSRHVFVVVNPTAGREGQTDQLRSELSRHFAPPRWTTEIVEATGQADVAALCRAACARGASLVLAAGGDGTVAGVANGLVYSQVPLGILPLGTGNDLARVLTVPLNLEAAVALLVADHTVMQVDALKVQDRYFFSNVSVGTSPHVVNETTSAQKKRFGRVAYLGTLIRRFRRLRSHAYTVTIDGEPHRIRAAEVMVSNTTLLEAPPRLFGSCETLNDGQLEVYLVTVRNWGDYLRLTWDMLRLQGRPAAKLHHFACRASVRIEAMQGPQLVQADGEMLGQTPVEVQLAPKALLVIKPNPPPTSPWSG